MVQETKIISTELQSIPANDILARFDELSEGINELKTKVSSKGETVLLTRQQTAKYLDVSLVTLHTWINKGIIPAYRIGNKVRFKQDEVLEALKNIPPRNNQ